MSEPSRTRDQHAPGLVEQITARGEAIRRRIAAVDDHHVSVLAVTKGHPPEVAIAAVEAGFTDLGENYSQELLAKDAAFAEAGMDRPRWHFIGRLQSNKVRQLAGIVHLWQSVDRESILREIARRAPGARVLIQVDLAGLGGRGGCAPEDAPALVRKAGDEGLAVEGLMGVGPPGDPEDSREQFRWLAGTATELGLPEVSMGMSADLEVAVEEGSTMVRIGTDLLGERESPG